MDRGRKRPAATTTPPESPLGSPRLGSVRDSCPELCKHLQQEEKKLRSDTFRSILNGELIQRTKDAKALLVEAQQVSSHADAIAHGLTKRVVSALHGTHHMSVQLTTWLGTFTPPLSVGGNAGVSAEVQDGMYANCQSLVQTCSDGLHRMLAFEKERATMHLRCLEEKGGTADERKAIWLRYEGALEENQLHELRKTCLMLRADLLCVAHTLQNNGEHLTTHVDQQLSMF
ncbi:hypothetical protein KFE25_006905 [Diacronema lutheri]|uniref:Uncharacterized protein n=2 Tax=Diacronema lutheri TaxID=2081491 RepID=A0A8J5XI18_DIALT|nr:hypothetical protein KFE25_006905 [Diacronema lutheri]